ncbi:hypothetical protein PIROE2DRAFT_9239 [Piromyces sp. E2]|nr:hypothetical protein PIROE2DRAFT_9239 [Piromyces sp. E2]|eukprot:OUM64074.1 hypothetical protein PIROE2DRAFT_9239 [Piromyces sp. E2]
MENKNMDNLIKREGKKVSSKRRTYMFLNINISCIATSMLGTALTTALPPIMKDLKITVDTGQWLTSGFGLFLAVMTPFTAFLISRFRTKRLYCIAVSFFIVGLSICAISKNFYLMMLGRIIQGCGNGLLSSMAQVIILTIYPPDRIGTMMGWYGLSIGVAPIIAPTLAGILVDTVGWRMIFIISIGIMCLSLICAIFVFEDVLPTMRKKFDVISLILSALTFGGITFAIGNMGTKDFVSYYVLFSFIVGIVSGIFFTYRQLHLKVPFLDVRILKNKDYSVSLASTVILNLILLGTSIVFPVYIQQIKRYSATISGLNALPGSLCMAIISPFAGKLYDKVGIKFLFIFGSLILSLSNFVTYFISFETSIWVVSFINIFRMVSIGCLLMPLVTWAMKDVPKYKASDATALYNSIRFIGGAVGSGLFISVMTKVANTIGKDMEHPTMYGFRVVNLVMAGFTFISVLLGIFGCNQKLFAKNNKSNEKEKNNKKSGQEMTVKDNSGVEIVVDGKKDPDNNSETITMVNQETSNDTDHIKDSSEIVMDHDISSKK